MYCPKCSHQAVSNNVRFCPGCGFRMDGVAELVANNGVFAAGEEKPPKPRRSMLKRGALLGATLMFFPLLILLPDVRNHPWERWTASYFSTWVALMTLIGVSGYLKRLITKIFSLIAKIFSEEEPSPSKKIASPRSQTPPTAYSAPVSDSGRQFVDTGKVAQPSSITEQTTSRLNNM
jgi:hypothetical protein